MMSSSNYHNQQRRDSPNSSGNKLHSATHRFSTDFTIYDNCESVASPQYELKNPAPILRALSILQGNPRTPQSPQAGFYFLEDVESYLEQLGTYYAENGISFGGDNHQNNNNNTTPPIKPHHMLVIRCSSRDDNISSTAFIENPNNSFFEPFPETRAERQKRLQQYQQQQQQNQNQNQNQNFYNNHPGNFQQPKMMLKQEGGLHRNNNNNINNLLPPSKTRNCILPTFVSNVNDVHDAINYCFTPYIGMKTAIDLQNAPTTATTMGSSSRSMLTGSSAKMFSSFFIGGRIRSTYNNNGKNNNNNNNNNNKKNELKMNFRFLPDCGTAANPRVNIEALLGNQGAVHSNAAVFPISIDKVFSNWLAPETRLVTVSYENNNNNNNNQMNNNNNVRVEPCYCQDDVRSLAAQFRLPNILKCKSFEEAGIKMVDDVRTVSNVGGFEDDVKPSNVNNNHVNNNNQQFPKNQQQQQQQVPNQTTGKPTCKPSTTRGPVNGIIFSGNYARELFADVLTMECTRVSIVWTSDRFIVTGKGSAHGDVVVEVNKPISRDERVRRLEALEEERSNLRLRNLPSGWNDANYHFLQEEPVLGFSCENASVQAEYSTPHFAAALGLETKNDVAGGRFVSSSSASGASSNFYNNNPSQNPYNNDYNYNNNNGMNQQQQNGGTTVQYQQPTITVQINSDRQLRVVHDNGFGVKIVFVIKAHIRDSSNVNNNPDAAAGSVNDDEDDIAF